MQVDVAGVAVSDSWEVSDLAECMGKPEGFVLSKALATRMHAVARLCVAKRVTAVALLKFDRKEMLLLVPKPSEVKTPEKWVYDASEIEAVSIASVKELPVAVVGFRKRLSDDGVPVLELVRFHSPSLEFTRRDPG
eukprot:COSAG04_NODE_3135_length_3131_cov_4.159301_2_plen_136_part_00